MSPLDFYIKELSVSLIKKQDLEETITILKDEGITHGFELGYIVYNTIKDLNPEHEHLKIELLNRLKIGDYKEQDQYNMHESPFKDLTVLNDFIKEATIHLIQAKIEDSSSIIFQIQNKFQSAYVIYNIINNLDSYLKDYPDLNIVKNEFLKEISEDWKRPLPVIREFEEKAALKDLHDKKLNYFIQKANTSLIINKDIKNTLNILRDEVFQFVNGFEAAFVVYQINQELKKNINNKPELITIKDDFMNELKKGQSKASVETDSDEFPRSNDSLDIFLKESVVSLIQYGNINNTMNILRQIQNTFQTAYIIDCLINTLDSYLPDYPAAEKIKHDFLKEIKSGEHEFVFQHNNKKFKF